MVKKLCSLLLLSMLLLSITSCTNKNTLLFLNWGEYVDEDLLEEFETEFNCTVVMDLAESNEAFYSKIKSGTTVYDVVCPSDYMVIKMYRRGLLSEIDFNKLTNYNPSNLLPGVNGIISSMEQSKEGVSKYFVPYLWGTWGIMYNKNKDGLYEAVTNSGDDWNSLFSRDLLPKNTKVAMYDSGLHAYYAACKYLDFDTTVELDESKLNEIYDLVKDFNYDTWGTDDIKKKIAAGNLDLGFMWTGDFLYYYCERIVNLVSEAYEKNSNLDFVKMITDLVEKGNYSSNGVEYQIGFDLFIPDDTIAFCDNLVIPAKSRHKDLAHEFINFMCRKENAYKNAYYVAYDTPFIDVYDDIVSLKQTEIIDGDLDMVYDLATGFAYQNYYPKYVENQKGYKGDILTAFDRKYINKINAVFNNTKV